MCSNPGVHIIPLSVWSVLELVRIVELRQNIKLIGFLTRFFPLISITYMLLATTDSQISRLRSGDRIGCSELALYPRKFGRGVESGEGSGPSHWRPVDAGPYLAGPLPEGGGKIQNRKR